MLIRLSISPAIPAVESVSALPPEHSMAMHVHSNPINALSQANVFGSTLQPAKSSDPREKARHLIIGPGLFSATTDNCESNSQSRHLTRVVQAAALLKYLNIQVNCINLAITVHIAPPTTSCKRPWGTHGSHRVRRILVEAAWNYRTTRAVSELLRRSFCIIKPDHPGRCHG